MTTIGIFASIFNDAGEVLCVQRNYPPYGWTTPGGRLEDGESPEDGIIREVLEETGYQVIVEKFIGIYAAPFKSDLVISFVCSVIGHVPWLPDDEIAAVRFFSVHALPNAMKNNTRIRIADAVTGQTGVSRTFSADVHD